MTTLNIQRTIKNPDDLASLVIDIYLDGISMVAEESGAHDVKKIIDRMSSDEKIVKALSGIIHTLAGDDLQTSFSLLNAVAKANEARESVGLAPVDAALPQATLH